MYETLKNLATGIESNVPSVQEIFGHQQITTNKEFLVRTAGIPAWDRWSLWNSEIAQPWEFTENNKEEYWNTFQELWPDTKESGDSFIREEVFNSFKNKSSEEQEQVFREKFRTWPDSLYPELEEHYQSLKTKNDTKQLERTIVLHRLELGKILSGLEYELDAQVPSEVHTNEWLRLYRMGYGKEISTENGRLGFPKNGTRVPAYTITDTEEEMSVEEQLIYLKYLKPMVKDRMSRLNKLALKRQVEQEKEIVASLSTQLNSPYVLDEHRYNIIIDTAKASKNPKEVTKSMIQSSIQSKIKTGVIKNNQQLIANYKNLVEGIKTTTERRLGNGTA